jgi:hypothetical protein
LFVIVIIIDDTIHFNFIIIQYDYKMYLVQDTFITKVSRNYT